MQMEDLEKMSNYTMAVALDILVIGVSVVVILDVEIDVAKVARAVVDGNVVEV
jgi:hypothetical protein